MCNSNYVVHLLTFEARLTIVNALKVESMGLEVSRRVKNFYSSFEAIATCPSHFL